MQARISREAAICFDFGARFVYDVVKARCGKQRLSAPGAGRLIRPAAGNRRRRRVRIWGKLIRENHLLKDTVAEIGGSDSRTHKVMAAMREICLRFDLPEPIWLDVNIRDFRRIARTRFYRDSFVEEIPFDYLDFQVIEEDDPFLF